MGKVGDEGSTRNPIVAGLAQILGDALVQAAQRPDVVEALREAFAPPCAAEPQHDPDALFSKAQLATKLAVSASTVDRLVRQGMPIAAHVGDSRRFDLDACKAWCAARDRKPIRARGVAR